MHPVRESLLHTSYEKRLGIVFSVKTTNQPGLGIFAANRLLNKLDLY